ncbi:unnamed protein product, partial [Oppiella nova]
MPNITGQTPPHESPLIELNANASEFSVFAAVRQWVLQKQLKDYVTSAVIVKALHRHYGTDTPFVRTLDRQAFIRDVRDREEWGDDTDCELSLLDTKYCTQQTLDALSVRFTNANFPLHPNPYIKSDFHCEELLKSQFDRVLDNYSEGLVVREFVFGFAITLFYCIEGIDCLKLRKPRFVESLFGKHTKFTAIPDITAYKGKEVVFSVELKAIIEDNVEEYLKARAQTVSGAILSALHNHDNRIKDCDHQNHSSLWALLIRSQFFHFYSLDISSQYLKHLRHSAVIPRSQEVVVKEYKTLDFTQAPHQRVIAHHLKNIFKSEKIPNRPLLTTRTTTQQMVSSDDESSDNKQTESVMKIPKVVGFGLDLMQTSVNKDAINEETDDRNGDQQIDVTEDITEPLCGFGQ